MKEYTYSSSKRFKSIIKIFGFFLISIGLIAVIYVFFPVASYYLYLSSAFASTEYQAPLPDRYVLKNQTEISGLIAHSVTSLASDYTDASNWFPEAEAKVNKGNLPGKVEEYTLSIPELEIEDAKVSAEDTELSEHLVEYFSTSDSPVEDGTSVIFGHSTLPQLFEENDYETIFANLHTLKTGDNFFVEVNGKEYEYEIFSVSVVTPEDPNIFSQSFDNSYITLVTCTPPGTVWKRLVLRASLVN